MSTTVTLTSAIPCLDIPHSCKEIETTITEMLPTPEQEPKSCPLCTLVETPHTTPKPDTLALIASSSRLTIEDSPFDLKHTVVEQSRVENIKVENCIGFAQVPLGIAGPLTIHGENQKGEFFAPLATVEATLVASCNRGCKVLQKCGGVQVAALSESMSRAPAFRFANVKDALAFYRLAPTLEATFRATAEASSKHARLQRITPTIIGTMVHIKFEYSCGDAAGQNMVTIATHRACQDFLKTSTAQDAKVIGFQIDGQLASDKKASWGNVRDGRGVQVLVWATLTDEVCRSVLRCGTYEFFRFCTSCEQGGIRNGQFGSNCNTSNIMAAIFMACGQDVASIFEAGFTHVTPEYNYETKDLTMSIYFPCMAVGTVGGGTGYATQKEALGLLDCFGAGKKWAFAESVAAFCLALEISTIGALANDTFSASHERLARLR